jgi:hypothetical protein
MRKPERETRAGRVNHPTVYQTFKGERVRRQTLAKIVKNLSIVTQEIGSSNAHSVC